MLVRIELKFLCWRHRGLTREWEQVCVCVLCKATKSSIVIKVIFVRVTGKRRKCFGWAWSEEHNNNNGLALNYCKQIDVKEWEGEAKRERGRNGIEEWKTDTTKQKENARQRQQAKLSKDKRPPTKRKRSEQSKRATERKSQRHGKKNLKHAPLTLA